MEVTFNKISESEFENKQTIPVLFYERLYSRYFGIIKGDTSNFKFGWRSDLLEPEIIKLSENVYGLGIDQNFAIVDFVQDKVLLTLNLTYNYSLVKIYEDNIFICTELEIIVVDKVTFTIVHTIALPDYFEDLIFENTKMKIICIGQLVIEQNIL